MKSLRGYSVSSANLLSRGFEFDRRFMVVDAQGKFLTMRQLPVMTLIKASITHELLTLTYRNGNFVLPYQKILLAPYQWRLVEVWDDRVRSVDMGDDVATWLSDILGQYCRLVYMPNEVERQVDVAFGQVGDIVSFADGFSLLLISQASLDALNSRLSLPITMERFRPNIVVEGCEPFAEDSWQRIKCGDIEFDIVKPCARCAIPSIDPETAERASEPWKTLSQFRRSKGQVYFGQNLVHRGEGDLSVGDRIQLIAS